MREADDPRPARPRDIATAKRVPDLDTLSPPEGLACPIRDVLAHIGGKWSLLTVFTLAEGSRRFGELRRAMPGISQRMLSATLRTLQRDGLVERRVIPSSPPGVDYRLTPLGHSMLEPLSRLTQWANTNYAAIRSARVKFLDDTAAAE